MNARLTAAALLVLALGAGSAMARGPEAGDHVGVFEKGGTGVEVRTERSTKPSYSLTGNVSEGSPAGQPEQRSEPGANQSRQAARFRANHVHQW